MSSLTLPLWIAIWLVISTIIVFADAGYVLARPHSMAGGKFTDFPMWNMYPLYYSIDRLYADMDNAFLKATAYMNLLENALNIVGLLTFRFGSRAAGLLILLVSVTTTLGKTVTYFIHEHCSPAATHPTAHNLPDNLVQYIFLYVVPNGLWIVFPLCIVYSLSSQLRRALEGGAATKQKKSK